MTFHEQLITIGCLWLSTERSHKYMEAVNRKVIYKLYPTDKQEKLLFNIFRTHKNLYNKLLEERISAWKDENKSLSFADQCKRITELRKEDPLLGTTNAQSLQVTAKRIDLAFQSFFRRVKSGETPGFPRFKSIERFSGWGYKTHGDGWKLEINEQKLVTRKQKSRVGKMRISGIGRIRIRGMARNEGKAVTMEIQKKGKRWFASVTFKCNPQRVSGTEAKAFDWGIENFLTIANEQETISVVQNPRFLNKSLKKIEIISKRLSLKKKGSRNRKKVKTELSNFHYHLANRRKDFLHKESAKLVETSNLIITEELNVSGMTKTPKAKIDEITGEFLPNGAACKAGLNRGILDGAPASFLAMCDIKAEEAGITLMKLPTRKIKPSQRCAMCGVVRKKTLSEREHICECGFQISRDANSALVMLKVGLGKLEIFEDISLKRKSSQGLVRCVSPPEGGEIHETPPISAKQIGWM